MKHIKKKHKWKSISWQDKTYLTFVYSVLILLALVCLYPLYFTVIASVSDAHEVFLGNVLLWPKKFTLESYKLVFENRSIWKGYANSIFYTLAGTSMHLFLTIPAAYALSRKDMLGRSFFMVVFMITMYFSGGLIPSYILYKKLNLINTRWILVLLGAVSVYNMIVAKTYFQTNIPESLNEAARIDGANDFQIFFQIVLPLSAPIVAVIGLYSAVGHWSSYFNAMVYTSNADIQPLQVVLRQILILNESAFEDAMKSGSADVIMDAERRSYLAITMKYALVFIASAPMLAIYPFVQKHFVKGIMVGSVKG